MSRHRQYSFVSEFATPKLGNHVGHRNRLVVVFRLWRWRCSGCGRGELGLSRLVNHSNRLRLQGPDLHRFGELFAEAKRGRHKAIMEQRETLKKAPEALAAELRETLEEEGQQCNIPSIATPPWSRHFARLRDHMTQTAIGKRGDEGEGYDDTVYFFCLGMQQLGMIAVFLEMKIVRGPLDDAGGDKMGGPDGLPLHYIRFEYMMPRYMMPDQIPFEKDDELIVFSGVVFKEDFAECHHAAEDMSMPMPSYCL